MSKNIDQNIITGDVESETINEIHENASPLCKEVDIHEKNILEINNVKGDNDTLEEKDLQEETKQVQEIIIDNKKDNENPKNNDTEKSTENVKTKFITGDEGELNTDEELEEGEVKDSGDEDEKLTDNEPKSVCRFYSKGACTWGDNCRFSHQKLPTSLIDPPDMNSLYNSSRSNFPQTPKITNKQTIQRQYSNNGQSNAWERGLKHAKAIMGKSSYKNEDDIEQRLSSPTEYLPRYSNTAGQYKNQESLDRYYHEDDTYRSYSKSKSQRDYSYDDGRDREYERKRRLALESAPWNDDEKYDSEDSWGRSKSFRKKISNSRQINKNDLSPSSLSNLSASDSFSDSGSYSDSFSDKSVHKKKCSKHKLNSAEKCSIDKRSKSNLNQNIKNESDSWSDSSSSSFFSDSDSDKEKRIQKRSNKESGTKNLNINKAKKSQNITNVKKKNCNEELKKKPIKMIFLKKQVNLKKDIGVASKLSEPQDDNCSGEENFESDSAENTRNYVDSKKETSKDLNTLSISRKSELLKQLKAVEDAIARKRAKLE